MSVQSMGYIGVDALELDAWRRFGTDVLAMQVIERGPDALALRMDQRCQRGTPLRHQGGARRAAADHPRAVRRS